MDIKYQIIEKDAKQLTVANADDSGWDLVACSDPTIEVRDIAGVNYVVNINYNTGIRVEFPDSYCGFVYPRSSIKKYDLLLSNSVGVIDQGYRGCIQASFRPIVNIELKNLPYLSIYKKGDRIAQLVIVKRCKVLMKEGLVSLDTERSTGGFGSSDKK